MLLKYNKALLLIVQALIVLTSHSVSCVNRQDFKTCEQSGFCRRQRNYKPEISPYEVIDFASIQVDRENGHVSAHIRNNDNSVLFKMDLSLLNDNRFKFTLDELNPVNNRQRYSVSSDIITTETVNPDKFRSVNNDGSSLTLITLKNSRAILYAKPFKLEFYIDDFLISSLNSQNLLKFEHYRLKKQQPPPPPPEEEGEGEKKEGEEEVKAEEKEEEKDEDDLWEERFKTHTDTKPFGPESIGLDISFHDFENVYGIPEHADTFSLRDTTSTDPYRLYNLDVFEYEINNPMALYASIPYMIAHNNNFTVGLLWLNAAETWVDISLSTAQKSIFSKLSSFVSSSDEIPQVNTHWMSESGIMELYILLGPTTSDVFRQLGELVGNTQLPPIFSIGYHQCRWNYNDEDDVKGINAGFEEHQLPMDVIWLDIEHTHEKQYFTWDALKFSNPTEMMNHISSFGRKMVTIVDPHIKQAAGYSIYNEAKDAGYFVKDREGKAIDGWCWPGSSSWPDFCDSNVQKWWASKFLVENYKGTTLDTYTWNDMNEPSMFNGPEVTFHKDSIHLNGYEHRNLHNLYGQCQVKATYEGHLEKGYHNKRPFILTRSAFVGSQRYGAIWTGDNTADWNHLRVSIPMLLSFSVGGMSFVGADVGGFFKNVDAELFVRWYQAAAYQPFFRSHAHIDTARREPWLFGDDNLNIIRDAIHARYSLLYYWYTLFEENESNGMPPMRSMWMEFPTDRSMFSIDDQHMVGSALLIKPIMTQGATSIGVKFPGNNELWYDVKGMKTYKGGDDVSETFNDISLSTVPVFQRGGYIVPYKFRLRRSSTQMIDDPFTLLITLDKNNSAKGKLYYDDTTSFNYKTKKEFNRLEMTFNDNKLTSKNLNKANMFKSKAWLERVIIYGYNNSKPKSVKVEHENSKQSEILEFTFDDANKVLLLRKPDVLMHVDWRIIIE